MEMKEVTCETGMHVTNRMDYELVISGERQFL
jgi:hypothetical protein